MASDCISNKPHIGRNYGTWVEPELSEDGVDRDDVRHEELSGLEWDLLRQREGERRD